MENNNENLSTQEERYIPEQYKEGHPNPTKAIILTFLIMLAFIVIQVVVMIPFMMPGVMTTLTEVKKSGTMLNDDELTRAMLGNVDTIALTVIATFISALVAVLWYRLAYCRNYGFAELKKTCKRVFNLRSVGGIVLAAISLFYMANYITALVGYISPSALKEYNDIIESLNLDMSDGLVIILTVVLAPINEECIMRGIIFTYLKKNMHVYIAITISAVYFGIFHLNVIQGVYAAVLGLFMAYLAYKYKSIIASMLFHAVFNGLNFIIILFPENVQNSAALGIIIPIVTGVLWFFVEGRRKIEEN